MNKFPLNPVSDPYLRETRGLGDNQFDQLTDQIFNEARAKVPLWSQGLMPRRDIFGEPIPATGPLQSYQNDPVVKALDDLHIGFSPPPLKIRGVALTHQQHDDYQRYAGRTLKPLLDDLMRTTGRALLATGKPEDRAKLAELMHRDILLSRKYAEDKVMQDATGSNNDIWAKATQAKKIKKGLVAPPQ
jgi:hypothetical protein